jgi:uncharacterized protein with ParB-like and HNH nuclease domain
MTKKITYGDLTQIELLSIDQLNKHPELEVFYVASYQRGYRWTKEEVEYLLNDINDISIDKKYCIQPLAVIARENKTWELIDGQQRTTTLFLIQTVLKNCFSIQTEPYYGLDYNTRSSTKDFLNDLRAKNILKDLLEDESENKWEVFVKNHPDKDNIDNYHLFNAYLIIYKWILPLTSEERVAFYKKLIEQTYIIWHPVTIEKEGVQTVEDFFINMNAGKIKLTSAELIKALFIIDIEKSEDPWDVRDFKKKKLANEWDSIENDLHNNTFWSFITNIAEQDYPTRIGKLFDIDCKKASGASELFSYYQYSKGKERGGENLDWKKIKQIYQRLKEWYEDVEIYHLVGFIINAKFMTLEDIIAKTNNKTKLETKDFFLQTIKDKFAQETTKDNQKYNVYAIDKLHYKDSYEECKNTLLLYNIKLIERTFPNQRFPFDLYQDPETKWSIEHIHPQNPQSLKSKEDAEEWLNDYEVRFKEEDEESENNTKIVLLKQKIHELKDNTLTIELSNQLKDFSNTVNDALGLHLIGNQALLDRITNSTIGNKGFLKKRSLILDASTNTNGTYIPLATINNFLKKTTDTGANKSIKVSYWSAQDAEDYTEDIKKLLEEFLPKNNN